jgi:glycosyltransferase involved in cell wall biosynthesis
MESIMRIIHLSDQFHPWMGYQETYLAKEHTRMGHDVLVIASNQYGKRRGASLGSREAPTGLNDEGEIQVLRLPIIFELPTEWSDPWIRGLVSAIHEFSPDIVHCHGILSISAVRAAVVKKQLGFGLVIDSHRAFFNVFHPNETRLKHFMKVVYYKVSARTFGRILVNRADAFTAIGEPEKEFVEWFYGPIAPKDIPIIRLGADHVRFQHNPEARKRIRREMGWNDDHVILGHAGTIDSKKGIDALLDAIMRLPVEQRKRIKIHLVGNIPDQYFSHLNFRCEDPQMYAEIRMTQFVPIDELVEMMSAWDIAIWAGDISNTALEAMAVGLPLIASRTPYTEYMIERHDAGILITRGDISDLIKALSSLVCDKELRNQKGVHARLAIEEDLNWERISSDFIELYEKILKNKEQPA